MNQFTERRSHQVVFVTFVLFFTTIVRFANAESAGTFDVIRYGATANDDTIDTDAIQRAIDACADAGGGKVVFTEGRYLASTIYLRSEVELHLEKGATVAGLSDPNVYTGFRGNNSEKSRWNHGLIVGENLQNVAIRGNGVIDGNKVFDPKGEAQMRGPHTILISNCKNVSLEGITIRDSGNYAFLFYGSTHVRVHHTTFEGGWDGVHFRGNPNLWNRDVRISECQFYTGDDSIAGHYIEDAVIENCVINSSCNGVRLIGPAKHLSFLKCEFFGPGRSEHRTLDDRHRTNMLAAITLQPSAWTPTPGPLEDIVVRDATIRNVACALHVSTRDGNTADRLTFENIKATEVYSQAISIESWTDTPIGKVTLRNIEVDYTPDAVVDPRMGHAPTLEDPIRKPGVGVWNRKLPVWGIYGRNIDEFILDRVTLNTADTQDARPVIRVDDVKTLSVEKLTHSAIPETAKTIERGQN